MKNNRQENNDNYSQYQDIMNVYLEKIDTVLHEFSKVSEGIYSSAQSNQFSENFLENGDTEQKNSTLNLERFSAKVDEIASTIEHASKKIENIFKFNENKTYTPSLSENMSDKPVETYNYSQHKLEENYTNSQQYQNNISILNPENSALKTIDNYLQSLESKLSQLPQFEQSQNTQSDGFDIPTFHSSVEDTVNYALHIQDHESLQNSYPHADNHSNNSQNFNVANLNVYTNSSDSQEIAHSLLESLEAEFNTNLVLAANTVVRIKG